MNTVKALARVRIFSKNFFPTKTSSPVLMQTLPRAQVSAFKSIHTSNINFNEENLSEPSQAKVAVKESTNEPTRTQVAVKSAGLQAVSAVKGNRGWKDARLDAKKTERETRYQEVVDIDALTLDEENEDETDSFERYPTIDTPDILYNGIKFKDLPYVNIRMHKNNTKLVARYADQRMIYQNTPAMHGFPKAKKKTAVGGQVAGLSMGQKLRSNGIKHVRVRLTGYNQARMSTVAGIVQAGIQVVCIQDATYIPWTWCQRGKRRPAGTYL